MCAPRRVTLVLLALLLAGGGWAGYRVYDYIENNPQFCNSCHVMNTAFRSWEESVHWDINCHECHQVSPLEGVQLVWIWWVRDPQKVTHRPVIKSASCSACHLSRDRKGDPKESSWAQVGASVGHRIHFVEKKVECIQCHSPGLHRFRPATAACLQCHSAGVRGAMGKFHCTVCHDFLGTGPTRKILPGREKCLGCHRNMEVAHEEFSETAPMNFPCGACHAPHAPLPHLPTRRNCMTCHGEKEMASQFKGVFLHSVPAHIDCAACHKPHLWKVAARSACATCHADRGEKHFPGMPCVTCHKVQIGKASETPSGSGPGSVVSRRLAGVHAPARKIALPSVRDRRPPAARTRRGD